ncbi:MAG: hypothetical protein E4H27_10370 [Anaerolineales bacterium]|nr:MAG: hypothetical protein E4H27_10370 [Anaerolineales bacterium]
MSSLPGLAYLLVKLGHVEWAVAVYSLASQQAFIANSRWFYDIAGKHIEKAAESLPTDVVEAAKACGRELDIWETAENLLVELNEDLAIRVSD